MVDGERTRYFARSMVQAFSVCGVLRPPFAHGNFVEHEAVHNDECPHSVVVVFGHVQLRAQLHVEPGDNTRLCKATLPADLVELAHVKYMNNRPSQTDCVT